ncbi:MAG: DUF1353 domain-containing protein [Crocinitomicaceae bacterium]|jgi:hypothetical protein|nr:DUF1353 domain-containing protein [Crocinitomicaceae bacterium]MBK6953758.1 DUF1353 domain-containing protein [Crocinitomicaceae bacterium]
MIPEVQTKLFQPIATKIDDTHFILKEDYVYYWKMPGLNADNTSEKYDVENWIIVKAGFRWDGASVPKFLWRFGFKTDGQHRAAALVHDFVYVYHGNLPEGSMISRYKDELHQNQYGSFSREDADRLFGRMMKEAGVSKGRRNFMKWGVTWFGWIFWQDGVDLKRGAVIKLLSFLAVLSTLIMLIVKL